MLNVVETSPKNILPLPFLFVDIRGILSGGDFVLRQIILFSGGDSVRRGFCPRGILSGGDYVRDSEKNDPIGKF